MKVIVYGAVPAEGRAVRVTPVPEPGAGGQAGPDPGQVIGVAELFVQGVGLAEQGRGPALIAPSGPSVRGVLQRAGPGWSGRVAPGGPLQGGGVTPDQPAGAVGGAATYGSPGVIAASRCVWLASAAARAWSPSASAPRTSSTAPSGSAIPPNKVICRCFSRSWT